MPELPEVETIRRGLAEQIVRERIHALIVRQPRLRWTIDADLPSRVAGQVIRGVERRAKYLLIDCGSGHLIIHLGMSGSLRVLPERAALRKHDHFDLVFEGGKILRYNDPRRFGSLHWSAAPDQHALIRNLGMEPLAAAFDGTWLHRATRMRKTAIKQFLMDQGELVGVGNIYANEALFRAGIRPGVAAQSLSRARCAALARAVKHTLTLALKSGGSTLRDYVNSDGEPGSFQLSYRVYGRDGQRCFRCGSEIKMTRQGQRGTFYCPRCQR